MGGFEDVQPLFAGGRVGAREAVVEEGLERGGFRARFGDEADEAGADVADALEGEGVRVRTGCAGAAASGLTGPAEDADQFAA